MKKTKLQTKFDDKKKVNIVQKKIVSVFAKAPNAEVLVLNKKTEVNLPNIIIKEEMVRNKILKLNVNKSCGPDEMHPQILI